MEYKLGREFLADAQGFLDGKALSSAEEMAKNPGVVHDNLRAMFRSEAGALRFMTVGTRRFRVPRRERYPARSVMHG